MYTTLDSNGYLKNASAGQLSQSAYFSLQLPYTVLGLGRSANFLDHLYVGIPRRPGETGIRKQEWTAIIPNSQLIVIPYPHNEPRSWSAKLYLTPSNSVLLTAIALIGVCVFILVIIGILHWQEKVRTHTCYSAVSILKPLPGDVLFQTEGERKSRLLTTSSRWIPVSLSCSPLASR
ncbi:hypothetical protein LDENG_00126910 [Lucifuga dentata]|nr:hypothetical protein LDENG_00126910 [Lucifuga dentata]